MSLKKIYIAGKITGIEEEAKTNFEIVEKYLIEKGYEPVNPMKLPHDHDKSWESYMKECIKYLCFCDGIYIMHNSFDSTGAIIEVQLSQKLGMFSIVEYPGEKEPIIFNSK